MSQYGICICLERPKYILQCHHTSLQMLKLSSWKLVLPKRASWHRVEGDTGKHTTTKTIEKKMLTGKTAVDDSLCTKRSTFLKAFALWAVPDYFRYKHLLASSFKSIFSWLISDAAWRRGTGVVCSFHRQPLHDQEISTHFPRLPLYHALCSHVSPQHSCSHRQLPGWCLYLSSGLKLFCMLWTAAAHLLTELQWATDTVICKY